MMAMTPRYVSHFNCTFLYLLLYSLLAPLFYSLVIHSCPLFSAYLNQLLLAVVSSMRIVTLQLLLDDFLGPAWIMVNFGNA
ncbi:hypothetical protein F5B17DRAFT_391861 [Nemania serpens]|nr:hypothetical protein F5B17DRAFT_391861 [Nemania serpens]